VAPQDNSFPASVSNTCCSIESGFLQLLISLKRWKEFKKVKLERTKKVVEVVLTSFVGEMTSGIMALMRKTLSKRNPNRTAPIFF
jgi:hypothetical protein